MVLWLSCAVSTNPFRSLLWLSLSYCGYPLWAAKQLTGLQALSFVVGAICSGLAGFFGMRVATAANVRTTAAARDGLAKALDVSFAGGTVMGMSVVGFGVTGLGGLFVNYSSIPALKGASQIGDVLTILSAFSLGASSIALFARVGGGIYTKAADVGAGPRG